MKKVIIGITLLCIFVLFIKIFPQKETIERTNKNMDNQYKFYKKENEERYRSYQEKYPNLTEIDILTRVNLNLDLPFYTNPKEAKNLNTNQVFVNKYNYLKEDYIPNNLEEIKSCVHGSKMLVKEAREQLEKLCEASQKENLQIRIISSYRSFDYQKTLYDKYVQEDGQEKADTYSARPGFSEHQTGLVIDVDNIISNFENFENTEEFQWMQKNAYKFGFILRYPKGKENITGYDYEAWHYRYVGEKIASIMHENNLTFDEYYAQFIDK